MNSHHIFMDDISDILIINNIEIIIEIYLYINRIDLSDLLYTDSSNRFDIGTIYYNRNDKALKNVLSYRKDTKTIWLHEMDESITQYYTSDFIPDIKTTIRRKKLDKLFD